MFDLCCFNNHHRTAMEWHIILILCMLFSLTAGGNVFITATAGEGSHYMAGTAVGEALVRRGHNVTVLIGDAFEHRAHHPIHSKLFKFEIFKHPFPADEVHARMEKIFSQAFKQSFNLELIANFSELFSPFIEDCRATLGDRDLMDRLSRAKFDVTVLDTTWLCSILLSEYLNTTNILLNPMASQYYIANLLSGAPFLPAVIPGGILGLPQRMTFLQRVSNVVSLIVLKQLFHLYGTFIDPLRDEFGILQDKSVSDYMANFSLILMSMDPVMDLIVPFPPSVIEVGGLLTKPAQQLNKVAMSSLPRPLEREATTWRALLWEKPSSDADIT
ncbi:UDP-glucuronosyltransferase 2B23-like [Diadema antillarum]|uniref:UDP-glucuronosyltransferase 2B23-like n=1 Tax=Diadema antillarum TaxID=105358 RepID=UPI003A8C5D78